MADWYDTPRYYDIVFGTTTGREARFLERVHRAYAGTGRRVLEPACGSGRLVAALARRGWRVSGFDLNHHMLAFARTRVGRSGRVADLWTDDMRRFRIRGRYDVAHCLVSSFKYLLTEADARAHLVRVARALRPGGVYVLGFHLTDYDETGCTRERWVASRGATRVVSNLQIWPADRRRRLERVRVRLAVDAPDGPRRVETQWWFRTYSVRQVRRLLRSVPQLEHVATFDFDYDRERRFDGSRLDVVLVLRRRPPRGKGAP